MRYPGAVVLMALLVACGKPADGTLEEDDSGPAGVDGAADGTADGVVDADGDSDGSDGSDGGSGPGGDADSDDGTDTSEIDDTAEALDTANPTAICDDAVTIAGIDECVADVLRCNRTVLHSTRNGTESFSGTEYSAWGCDAAFPADRYTSRERVYSYTHPGDGVPMDIELSSPCGELDLIVIPWASWIPGDGPGVPPTGECPTSGSSVPAEECVWRHRSGDDGHRINGDVETRYLVIVDGPTGPGINYELTTSCGGGGGPGGGTGGGGTGGGGTGGGTAGGGPGDGGTADAGSPT